MKQNVKFYFLALRAIRRFTEKTQSVAVLALLLLMTAAAGAAAQDQNELLGDDIAKRCATYAREFGDAKRRMEMESRFSSPAFSLDASKKLKGNPVLVAKVTDSEELVIACDNAGRLASMSISGNGVKDDDFNRFAALTATALASISKSSSRSLIGQSFFNWYSLADKALRQGRIVDNRGGSASDRLEDYNIRVTVFPSRAMRLEMAMDGQPFIHDADGLAPKEATAQPDERDTGWRCDPSDPDGKTGRGDFSGRQGNVMPPIPVEGSCIIRAQPHHLYRSPRPLLGRTVEMDSMGCYRHGDGDYRCIPFQAHRGSSESYGVIIMAPSIAEAGLEDMMDENCPTMRRGLESRRCSFMIRFKMLEFGTDHTETIRWIRADSITLVQ